MAKKQDADKKFSVEQDGSRRRRFRTAVITLAIIAAITLGAAAWLSTTDGFRGWLESRLEAATGLKLEIDETGPGFIYHLVIKQLRTETDPDDGLSPRLEVEEVSMGLTPSFRYWVRLRGCRLDLSRDEDGGWTPAPFAQLGNASDIVEMIQLSQLFREDIDLEIVRGSVTWYGADGSRTARIRDMDLSISPVKLKNGRRLYYCSLSASLLTAEDGSEMDGVRREWLITEDNTLIDISATKARQGDPEAQYISP